jgi:hypothetical protein
MPTGSFAAVAAESTNEDEMDVLSPAEEAGRWPSPGTEPMGLAFSHGTLWISCRESHRLYAMDTSCSTISEEVQTPGAPFGLAFFQDKLHVVIGHGNDDDDRYIYRYVLGRGFEDDPVACPGLSGLHLASVGETLFLSQAHNRKILALDQSGEVIKEIALDRVPVGMTVVGDSFYLVTGDRKFKNLQLGRLEPSEGAASVVTPMASIPFNARGLAFDGKRFWTAERNKNEIVTLATPAPG